MHDYLKILLGSFFATAIAIPVIIRLAMRTNLLDVPKGDALKIHENPIPVLGGLGITLAVLLSLFVGSQLVHESRSSLLGVGAAVVILFFIGLYDDYKGLSPYKRLIGQAMAALGAVLLSQSTVHLFPNQFISSVLTILCLVTFINAMNLLDGIDGLASAITLVAATGFLVAFIALANALGILLSLALIGCSAGFLIYNFAPAKIFLGDNGSTVLGFLLGMLAVIFASRSEAVAHFTVPLLILIVPLADTASAIIRRLIKRRPLLHGDREHLYDQLLSLGLSSRQTTGLMCCFGVVGTLGAIFVVLSYTEGVQ